tara:strand:- start:3919 stop:5520 length:1602 start_codon:yes stop_codon:yes gene_type:complete
MARPSVQPLAIAGLLLSVHLTTPAVAQDVFQPRQVWVHHPDAGTPWIPGDVHLTGRENLAIGAMGGANPRWLAIDTHASGTVGARFVEVGGHRLAQSIRTAAARDVARGFALDAIPIPNSTFRNLFVGGYDLGDAAQSQGLGATWLHAMSGVSDGTTQLACSKDGRIVVAAGHDTSLDTVHVEVLLGETGAVLTQLDLDGVALNALDVSDDGRRIAISAGLDLYVIDHLGTMRHHETLAYSSRAISLAHDGSRLAVGALGSLRVLEDAPGAWVPVFTLNRAADEVASCVDLDADGTTLAAGWWNHVIGSSARLEMWNVDANTLHNDLELGTSPGARQNLPEVVRIVADGHRAAFGTWGDDVSLPEVFLLARGFDVPVATFDVSGSVRGLDIDALGRRVLVAHKSTHNNEFSSVGAIRLFDTGEGELRQLTAAVHGQPVSFAVRPEVPASISLLVHGVRAHTPLSIPGVPGALLVDRGSASIQAAVLGSSGQAIHTLQVPDDPDLIGTYLAVQSVLRGPSGTRFSDDWLAPLVF